MGPIKKQKLVKKSKEEENEEETFSNNTVEATFEGRNLEEADFHGIRQLIQQIFVKAHVDISQMTDMLIKQFGIGSVLKQVVDDDDEDESDDMEDDVNDVFGVTSVFNLSAHRDTPCVHEIYEFLQEQSEKYGNETSQNAFKDILNSRAEIGLLINERFLNIPAAVSAPMLSSLKEEIIRMKKKNPSYNFQKFIMICKTYRSKCEEEDTSFSNEEECIFSTHADCSFEYSVAQESDTAMAGKWKTKKDEAIPFRKVLLISADKFENIISQIITYIQT